MEDTVKQKLPEPNFLNIAKERFDSLSENESHWVAEGMDWMWKAVDVSSLDVQKLRKTQSDAEFRKMLSMMLTSNVNKKAKGL